MDKLASIRAFTKVVAARQFLRRPARELRLSRSAVSKYVIELEEELGVQLLNRTTRSVSPTENGQAYYERCLAILADLEEADLAVGATASRAARPAARQRADVVRHAASRAALADFMAKYPELAVQLVLSDQLIDPVQDGFDVTLRIADLPSSSLIARKIVPAKRVICASPAYLAPRHAAASRRSARPRLPDLRPSRDRQPVEADRARMAITGFRSRGRSAPTTPRCCATRR